MKKNKKGFTLIELLAVIIILGVLLLIAIPSVTAYITNSRKSTFVATAGNFVNAVTIKVNEATDVKVSDPTKAYFIPVSDKENESCVKVEKGGRSPYGDWDGAYVIVTVNSTATSYKYYFMGKDKGGFGMYPTTASAMTKESVVSEGIPATGFIPTIATTLNSSTAEEYHKLPGETRELTPVFYEVDPDTGKCQLAD